MARAGERQAAAVEALFAELWRAGERRPRQREILLGPLDEDALLAVLRRAVPVALLEEVAAVRPWSERARVLARVVLHPRVPRSLGLRLVGSLGWRDLADVAATLRVSGGLRARAESLLCDGLADMRLGDRVTLARLATPALLPLLLAQAEPRVVEAALTNSRLREEDLVNALRRDDVRPRLVEAASASPRWATSYAVRLAIVLQPRAPLPVALAQISGLVPHDLRRVTCQPSLHPLVALSALRVLERAAANRTRKQS